MNMVTVVKKTVLVQFLFSRKVEFEVPSGMDGITERVVLIEKIKSSYKVRITNEGKVMLQIKD